MANLPIDAQKASVSMSTGYTRILEGAHTPSILNQQTISGSYRFYKKYSIQLSYSKWNKKKTGLSLPDAVQYFLPNDTSRWVGTLFSQIQYSFIDIQVNYLKRVYKNIGLQFHGGFSYARGTDTRITRYFVNSFYPYDVLLWS